MKTLTRAEKRTVIDTEVLLNESLSILKQTESLLNLVANKLGHLTHGTEMDTLKLRTKIYLFIEKYNDERGLK